MTVTPYIIFDGHCEEAFHLYAKALNGEIRALSRYSEMPGEPSAYTPADTNRIMHAELAAGELVIMGADSNRIASGEGREKVHLSLSFDDAEAQEKTFNVLAEGGHITMPLQDTFWGARFGMLVDRFGINWMFNYDKPKS